MFRFFIFEQERNTARLSDLLIFKHIVIDIAENMEVIDHKGK